MRWRFLILGALPLPKVHLHKDEQTPINTRLEKQTAMESPLVFFDIETTSLNRQDGEIISIAAWCEGESFTSLVNPLCPIPASSTRIHGLTDMDVCSSPPWADVGPRFLRWVLQVAGKTPTLVAFNGYEFDLPWIIQKNSQVDSTLFPSFDHVHASDPLVVARKHFSRAEVGGSFKQAAIYRWLFGHEPTAQHTADGDVAALVRIAEHERFASIIAGSRRRIQDITGKHLVSV